jgi:hypothetical protein
VGSLTSPGLNRPWRPVKGIIIRIIFIPGLSYREPNMFKILSVRVIVYL